MSGGSSFDDYMEKEWIDSVTEAIKSHREAVSAVHLSENATPEEKAAALEVGGARWNAGKARWDLLPFDALVEVVSVYTKGADKYKDRNWEKGMSWGICIAATFRHFTSWLLGETNDKETGCNHLAHAVWNLLALLTYQLRGMNEFDDRKLGV